MSHVLPDVLQEGLMLVFCGTAASTKSAQVGAYYANPTNAFWKTLYAVGMTSRQLQPTEFWQLVDYGMGLTDIAKDATGNDSDLSADDFDGTSLQQKIAHYQPNILAFTSKRAYREWCGISSSKSVAYGWQDKTINQTKIFVLPSPSGAARGYWDVTVWQSLADAYGQLRVEHGKYD